MDTGTRPLPTGGSSEQLLPHPDRGLICELHFTFTVSLGGTFLVPPTVCVGQGS